jgi:tetratricopeptide (TPR) repeat protein
MKTLILVLTAVALTGAAAWFLIRNSQPDATREKLAAQKVAAQADVSANEFLPPTVRSRPAITVEKEAPAPLAKQPAGGTAATSAPVPRAAVSPGYQQTLESLVSPQSTFAQKQAAWQQLRDSGKLDQFITDMEQRAAVNPNVAELPATLGQAYLQKAGSITDLREQGILGMKADQSFEAALNIDTSNWEARFWKATAMSYWPTQLGKGREVIENFLELVKQQETMSPQPQFAQTYVRLGEQYQKEGYPDYAKQTWERGMVLYPQDQQLKQRLTNPPTAQQTAN